VAGARPGLQNRGADDASAVFHKGLGKSTHSATAQGQRAKSNDPDLTVVVDAWDRLPEAVRASILMLVKAASKG
jgi:hypothetical protein